VWLNLPQAVVLSATRSIALALGLTDDNPDLLLLKANRILGVRAAVPLETEATDEQRRDAYKQLRHASLATDGESRYLVAQRRLAELLAAGVTVKASRKYNGPYEVVDPAEFTRLELRGGDAIDKLSKNLVLFDLRINMSELNEIMKMEEEQSEVSNIYYNQLKESAELLQKTGAGGARW
jgi:hypothetical protein